MVCPKCDIETQLQKHLIVCEGDNSPDTETKVFSELHMECRNPRCSEYKSVVEIIREQINKRGQQ